MLWKEDRKGIQILVYCWVDLKGYFTLPFWDIFWIFVPICWESFEKSPSRPPWYDEDIPKLLFAIFDLQEWDAYCHGKSVIDQQRSNTVNRVNKAVEYNNKKTVSQVNANCSIFDNQLFNRVRSNFNQ